MNDVQQIRLLDTKSNCFRWHTPYPPTFCVEYARSGRSKCTQCITAIAKDELRLGVVLRDATRTRFQSHTCWFHLHCFDNRRYYGLKRTNFEGFDNLSRRDINVLDSHLALKQPPKFPKPFIARHGLKNFSRACRVAVVDSITGFKESHLDDECVCPVTGITLNEANSHVHHAKPKEFKDIVCEFIAIKTIDVETIRYKMGEFIDFPMSERFKAFHDQNARLVLVHQQANLSLLKTTHADWGVCDVCHQFMPIEFLEGLNVHTCRYCRFESKGFLISKTRAMRLFLLLPEELSGLVYAPRPNPLNKGYSPMKLYRRKGVRGVAITKFGSLEALQMKQRNKRRSKLEVHSRLLMHITSSTRELRSGRTSRDSRMIARMEWKKRNHRDSWRKSFEWQIRVSDAEERSV